MRFLTAALTAALLAASCSSSTAAGPDDQSTADAETTVTAAATEPSESESSSVKGPGGYGFDRSDPEAGIANIMAAFAADEETATCIYEAWGDVANVPPAELTPELMTFEICGTSIFQLMTGDGRFTGAGG